MTAFPRIREIARALRSLAPRERWIYLRLVISGRRHPCGSPSPPLPRTVRSVLFVCQGNIIRSAFAGALFPQVLPPGLREHIAVSSAGLETTPGKTADPRAIQAAGELGVSLEAHRTRQLTPALVDTADLIVAMDSLNVARYLVRHPRADAKLFMLGAFGDATSGAAPEIKDPYAGDLDDVRGCYRTISERLSCLASALARQAAGPPTPAPRNGARCG